MSLDCLCDCDDESDVVFFDPDDYSIMPARKRRVRCKSCKEIISDGDVVAEFRIVRQNMSEVEERIYGDDGVPLASRFLCESCSDIFFNLFERGFNVGPYEDLRKTMQDYINVYKPKKL